MSNGPTLSSSDVAKLLQDPNADNRAEAATKVASTFAASTLSDSERQIAEDIFRSMLKDAAVRVRQALSESLKDNPDVPHDVATSLATDVDEVALPIIENSVVLTDEDLVSIVQTKSVMAQKAVARRSTVSSTVADALADTNDEDVVAELVKNEGANITEGTYKKVLNQFADSDAVKEPMAMRASLPLSVSERLVSMVSERLREHIMTHHEVSAETASDLLFSMREKATVSLLKTGSERSSVLEMVDQLYANRRLTPSLVIRALCMGDTTFFEAALARMANIPVANAYTLVHDKGELGLSRLFERAHIPQAYVTIARAAVDVAYETQSTAGDDRELLRQLIIERVLTAVEDQVDGDNLDYLIGKLHRVNDT